MVFPNAKGVDAHLIGMLDLFDELTKTFLRTDGEAAVVKGYGKAINPDLHGFSFTPLRACDEARGWRSRSRRRR
jgi:hypothetical protein